MRVCILRTVRKAALGREVELRDFRHKIATTATIAAASIDINIGYVQSIGK